MHTSYLQQFARIARARHIRAIAWARILPVSKILGVIK